MKKITATSVVLAAGLAALAAACGTAQFQTARTVPRGKIELAPAAGVIYNENVQERGFQISNVQPNLGLRIGLADRVDIGVQQLLLIGLLVDTKVNMMPPAWKFALAVRGGVGAAYDPFGFKANSTAWVVHVPLFLIASYTIKERYTPYVSAGYSFFWIFAKGGKEEDPETLVERKGYGDGMLRFNAGFEAAVDRKGRIFLLVEYSYWRPVVDDPGDSFAFLDSHLIAAGMKFWF